MSDAGNTQEMDGTESAASTAAETMVQANIDAYNAHDLDAYLATFTPAATFGQLGGRVLLDGREAMRKFYRQFFDSRPRVQCAVKQRAVLGRFVVEVQEIYEPVTEQTVAGMPPMQAMVISEIALSDPGGRIGKVWYAPLSVGPAGPIGRPGQ